MTYRPRLSKDEYELILKHREETATTSARHVTSKMVLPDHKTRILVYDIETAPSLSYVWGRFKQNISQEMVVEEGYILCYVAKWLGDDIHMVDALPFHGKNEDDKEVTQSLWTLMNEADMVIAHNGDNFDNKVGNTRFVYHGLNPPSPIKSVDTLKIAKSRFKFPSNRLDSIGQFLGLGRKEETGGFRLWEGCMRGDQESWDKMINYCIRDVDLLEKIYMKLRAWDKRHPSVALLYEDDKMRCRVCGSENVREMDFFTHTPVSSYVTYRCDDCGHYHRGRKNVRSREQMDNTLANAL